MAIKVGNNRSNPRENPEYEKRIVKENYLKKLERLKREFPRDERVKK